MGKKGMDKKKIVAIAGMAVGAVVVIMGIWCMMFECSYYGSYSDYASFGADFYTYSYQATMNAANNVQKLGYVVADAANAIVKAFGMLLIAVGAIDVVCFLDKFMQCSGTEDVQKDETPVVTEMNLEEVALAAEESEEAVSVEADEEPTVEE